jgi:threonyl-tRNA synthetase
MLVIGEQESVQKVISVRSHGGNDYGKMKVEDFVKIIKEKTKI